MADQEKTGWVESGVLTLERPLQVDGEAWATLQYDFDQMSGEQCLDALDRTRPQHAAGQTDLSDRQGFALFAEAVCACHSPLQAVDLLRLHPKDVLLGARLGRGFFTRACLGALTRIGDASPK